MKIENIFGWKLSLTNCWQSMLSHHPKPKKCFQSSAKFVSGDRSPPGENLYHAASPMPVATRCLLPSRSTCGSCGRVPARWNQESVDDMSENSETQLSSISGADTYEAIGEFWDTHTAALITGIRAMMSNLR